MKGKNTCSLLNQKAANNSCFQENIHLYIKCARVEINMQGNVKVKWEDGKFGINMN